MHRCFLFILYALNANKTKFVQASSNFSIHAVIMSCKKEYEIDISRLKTIENEFPFVFS